MTTPTPVEKPTWMPGTGRRQWLTYLLLGVMALADAYAFWTTLDALLGKDKEFLLVVVIALSLGAVAGAHKIGGMARRQRINGADYPALPVVGLTLVWLAVGLIMYWIRAHQSDSTPAGIGPLNLSAAPANDSSPTFALLLLALYLLTGALAAEHAYRFGDPRPKELIEAIKERKRLNRKLVQWRYRLQYQDDLVQQNLDEQKRESADRDGKKEEAEAWGDELYTHQGETIAEQLGDPAATDAVTKRNGLN